MVKIEISGSVSTNAYDGRYYKVSWTVEQSISNNTSEISWKLEALGGNSSWYAERTLEVVIAGVAVYSKSSRVERYTGTINSGTVTVKHNSFGEASFAISVKAAVYTSNVNLNGSKTFILDVIQRKSTLAVENGTLGTEQTLTVERRSTTFTHTITATCGDQSETISTKSMVESFSFTPPLDWAKENISGTNISVKYTITTYNGSTSVGSNNYTVTCSMPDSIKPVVVATVSEGLLENFNVFVQGVSKLRINIAASTAYDSPIVSYKTVVDGKTYTETKFTTDFLSGSGTMSIDITVTDQRGRKGTTSHKINVLEYKAPVFSNAKVNRCNSDGTENILGEYGKVSYECTAKSLGGNNEITFCVYYKKSSEANYTLHQSIPMGWFDEGTVFELSSMFPAESGSAYDVMVVAKDFAKSSMYKAVLSTGFSIMHFLTTGLGMAIGKISELSGVLDIGFKTRFNGGIRLDTLASGTDWDTLMTTNAYNIGPSYAYINAPESGVGGVLEVRGSTDEINASQLFRVGAKENPRVYERSRYEDEWGAWIRVRQFKNKVLWSGVQTMTASQTATLSEAVSKQRNGIVLMFSAYEDNEAKDYNFVEFFIPKHAVELHPGASHNFSMNTSTFAYIVEKQLFIHDDKIVGHANNTASGTNNGVTFQNSFYVMRYVLGV